MVAVSYAEPIERTPDPEGPPVFAAPVHQWLGRQAPDANRRYLVRIAVCGQELPTLDRSGRWQYQHEELPEGVEICGPCWEQPRG